MPSFPKPDFPYTVNVSKEIKALRTYRDTKPGRQIPKSTTNNLLVATWNVANLGAQDRQDEHFKLIAEIISWFDLVAVQETKENYEHLLAIKEKLSSSYKYIFSDESGNNERMAFLYKGSKISLMEEVAELAVPPSEFNDIKLPGITETFSGFDRSPYMASFKVKQTSLCLLNVHLYYGSESEKASINRRSLEAYCVGRWADLRSKSKFSYTGNVLALGDFNLHKRDTDDPVYQALVRRGLQLPEHTSKIFSNLNDDKAYDQIAFLPGLKSRILSDGIFDFDGAIFSDLFQDKTPTQFRSYLRYYISDHRPMWMELDIS
ncbi:MAG: endonuclease/exonuclease/phosphatase family protein [Flavisolibacter sp.]|nr:endonuclease/exonuclease/phosphatase family protein [Flavisolibacter sp.]